MKNKKMYIGIFLTLLILVLAIKLPGTLSRFSSSLSGSANGGIAFYVIEPKYQSQDIKLDEMVPSEEEYKYYFSVANYNAEKRLETNAEYNIIIRTTTNLNLEYKLYKKDSTVDLLIEKNIEPDTDGTYFNIMKTEKEKFGFKENQKNEYILSVKFPIEYIAYDYQDIIESVEIIIDSSQIAD